MSRSMKPVHLLKLKWLLGVREAFKELEEEERAMLADLRKHKRTKELTISILDLIYSRVRLVTTGRKNGRH